MNSLSKKMDELCVGLTIFESEVFVVDVGSSEVKRSINMLLSSCGNSDFEEEGDFLEIQ